MAYINITDSTDITISGSTFDGPGEHIKGARNSNMRVHSNIHRDTQTLWISLVQEIQKSTLPNKKKERLLKEAQTILNHPTQKEVDGFRGRLSIAGNIAFYTTSR